MANLNLFDELIAEVFNRPYVNREAEAIHMEVELPGVKKEEIKVSIEDGYLKIGVESKRRRGSRVVSLSKQHDIEKATVKYEDGLLTIDVPLSKPDKKEQRILDIK